MRISKKNNKQISYTTLNDLTDFSFEKIVKNDCGTCPHLEDFILSTTNTKYSKVNFLSYKIRD